MAIKVYGVPASIDAGHWAQLMQDLGDADAGMTVPSGLTATVSGSNLSVTAGRSLQAGTLAISDVVATVPVTANTKGNPRIDLLCMQVDWSGTTDTAGSFVVVQGAAAASPAVPAVIQTPGVLWQTPLFQYTVAASASVASSLLDVRPRRDVGAYRAATIGGTWVNDGSQPLSVARRNHVTYLTGRFRSNGTVVAVGGSVNFAGVQMVPTGYRPSHAQYIPCTTDLGTSNPRSALLVIDTDGSAVIWPISGPITGNDLYRVASTSWLTEGF